MKLLREDGNTISDDKSYLLVKVKNVYVNALINSTLWQIYRKNSPWATLYDTTLTVSYPKRLEAEDIQVLISPDFYLQFNQNTFIKRPYAYAGDLIYSSNTVAGSKGALYSFKGYHGGTSAYYAVCASTVIFSSVEEGITGFGGTSHRVELP